MFPLFPGGGACILGTMETRFAADDDTFPVAAVTAR